MITRFNIINFLHLTIHRACKDKNAAADLLLDHDADSVLLMMNEVDEEQPPPDKVLALMEQQQRRPAVTQAAEDLFKTCIANANKKAAHRLAQTDAARGIGASTGCSSLQDSVTDSRLGGERA
jgi:hypothetical protein